MTYIVGVYWGQREESRQACANRCSAFFNSMATQDIGLAKWYKKSGTRKTAPSELPHDANLLRSILKTNNRDIGGDAIAELGFNLSAWTGGDADTSASLSLTCGAYSPVIRNVAVVAFDTKAKPSLDTLQLVFKAAVAAFEPEDGVVSSLESLSTNVTLPPWKAPAIFRYKQGAGFSAD